MAWRRALPIALVLLLLSQVPAMDGPVVLAGLFDGERALDAEGAGPATLLMPDNEREWNRWTARYRVHGQQGLRFIPLHEVTHQRCTVYFPVR